MSGIVSATLQEARARAVRCGKAAAMFTTYGDLLKPASIGSMQLKNRICMAPMDFKFFSGDAEDSTLTHRHNCVFAERARGGCGLIFTCATQAELKVMPYPHDMQFLTIHRDERIKDFAEAADMVHVWGAKIGCELTMGSGRYFDTPVPGADPIAPSACETQYDPTIHARAMTKAEIAYMIESYADAAARLKIAGFDCLLVMGQGGYLINQFLSPAWNQRDDEYGGTLENRARFLRETLRAVKRKVGESFPIVLGVNMDDLLPEVVSPHPGITVDEQIAVCRLLEEEGLVDVYQLRIGNYYDQESIVPSAYHDNTPYRENFARFHAGVTRPCIFENRLDDPVEMQEMLEAGEAEFFSLGRMWIANSDLVDRWQHGEAVRQCLRCNHCLHTLWLGKHAKCAINPALGHEFEGEMPPARRRKRVVVVGAGPAGATAALTAAERGHDVVLLEATECVGGRIDEVAAPSYKHHDLRYQEYLAAEVARAGVDARYGVRATSEDVLALAPDSVVVAVGAEPIVPPVPGVERAVLADDVLRGRARVSGTIAIVGGGLVGAECASVLAEAGCAVHLIEMQDDVLKDASYVTRHAQLRTLAQTGAAVHVSTQLTAVCEDAIEVETLEGAETIPCNAVVLAVGYRATGALAAELCEQVREVYEVGDARAARRIADAIEEAYEIARRL